jgi:hypothetical protein
LGFGIGVGRRRGAHQVVARPAGRLSVVARAWLLGLRAGGARLLGPDWRAPGWWGWLLVVFLGVHA